MNIRHFVRALAKVGVLFLTLFTVTVVFGEDKTGISGVAGSVTSAFGSIAELLLAIAYVAGIGFAVASIFKFKQHKDNPTQIPIGTPIALLAIAVALIFLGFLIQPLGETLTGKTGDELKSQTAGATGGGAAVPGLEPKK